MVLDVAGSNPVFHPNKSSVLSIKLTLNQIRVFLFTTLKTMLIYKNSSKMLLIGSAVTVLFTENGCLGECVFLIRKI